MTLQESAANPDLLREAARLGIADIEAGRYRTFRTAGALADPHACSPSPGKCEEVKSVSEREPLIRGLVPPRSSAPHL